MHLTSPDDGHHGGRHLQRAHHRGAHPPWRCKGVKYREASSQSLLSRNLLVYGLGGIVLPFVVIKLLDMMLDGFGCWR